MMASMTLPSPLEKAKYMLNVMRAANKRYKEEIDQDRESISVLEACLLHLQQQKRNMTHRDTSFSHRRNSGELRDRQSTLRTDLSHRQVGPTHSSALGPSLGSHRTKTSHDSVGKLGYISSITPARLSSKNVNKKNEDVLQYSAERLLSSLSQMDLRRKCDSKSKLIDDNKNMNRYSLYQDHSLQDLTHLQSDTKIQINLISPTISSKTSKIRKQSNRLMASPTSSILSKQTPSTILKAQSAAGETRTLKDSTFNIGSKKSLTKEEIQKILQKPSFHRDPQQQHIKKTSFRA